MMIEQILQLPVEDLLRSARMGVHYSRIFLK